MKINEEAVKHLTDNIIDKKDEFVNNASQNTAENEKTKKIYYFPPISEEINDMKHLINILSENVNKLIQIAKCFDDELSLTLVSCFGNLKTYINRLDHLYSEQQIDLNPKMKYNILTETKSIQNDKLMQMPVIGKCTTNQQISQKSFRQVAFDALINSLPSEVCKVCKPKTNIFKEKNELKSISSRLKNIQLSKNTFCVN